MSKENFNKKWKKYLKKGHYGLDINDEKVITTLDNIFEDLTKIKGFKFIQIKTKFSSVRFYAEGISWDLTSAIENKIEEILNIREKNSPKSLA